MTDNGLAAYLKSELQLLSTEARKKHPEIKEASERVIVILRTQKNLPNTGQNEVARELAKSEDALRPLFMACETKQPKLVAVAMRCLQRLSQHSAIASASIRVVFKALDSVADIDMDTQIKILQILLPIVRNYESIRGGVLAEAFLLCFKLLAVDNSVISNTAKATLRQLIDVVFERAATANPNRDREPENGAAPALDDGCDIKSDGKESTTKLGSTPLDPLVKDAYFILQDLALLIRGEEPVFIWIKHLDKAFVYELIETILSNHARVFTQHGELRMLVCEKLTPLFILFLESTTDEPPFQHIVMQFRLILCFIRNWATDIPAETEFFVSLIVRLAESMPDSDGGSSILGLEGGRIFGNDGLGAAGRKTVVARSLDAYSFSSGGQEASSIIIPSYIRVLALEVVQQVCATGGLLKALYSQFDYAEDGCKVVQSIVVALGKVTTERPELCSPAINDQPQERSNDTMAAAATMSEDKDAKDDRAPVDQRSLITRNSLTPRISVLQLYDRAVLPTLPEHYLFYLAFASTLEIVKAMVGDMFDSLPVIQGPRSGSRILASFISDAEDDEKASLARHWATENWPITLATFSFFMNVDLEPALFQQMLRSLETMVKAVGAFDMMLARDSYISMLYRNCLPNSTIAQYDRQQRQRHSVGGGGRQLATLSSPEIPFTMGYRHLQSLMTLLNCAEFLANSLDSLWYPIVVTYQQAEEVLYRNHGNAVAPGDDKPTTNYTAATAAVGAAATVSPGGSDGNINDKPFFGRAQFNSSLPKDAASLISRFDCLLLSVKDFNCRGFMWFVGALCTLDVDISGMPVRRKHRKFVQSMHQRASFPVLLPTALTRLVFPIRVLREVALDNMDRLLNISPETHENGSASRLAEFAGLTSLGLVMHHLLDTATYINAVEPLKTQACEVAAAVMLGTMEYVVRLSAETDSATQAKDSDEIQLRILTPLAQMMVTSERYRSESFDESEHRLFSPSVEVKALALDTLNRLLQTSGHSIVSAWEVVFEILKSVVDEAMVKYGQYPASHSRDNTLGENAINVTASAGARDNAGHDDGHVQAEAGTVAKSMATATTLVRAAFACLQLVCSDFLSALPAPSLRQCIDSIGRYGRQRGDLNLALTSVGLAWDMSNHLRGLIQSADQEGQTAEADDGLSKDGLVIEELWLAGLENTATPNARTVRIL
ncbi:Endocytosis and vacuole integrity protein, partial [Spiromyces aspiralis]